MRNQETRSTTDSKMLSRRFLAPSTCLCSVPIFDRGEKTGNQRNMLIIHTGRFRAKLSFPSKGLIGQLYLFILAFLYGSLRDLSTQEKLVKSQETRKGTKQRGSASTCIHPRSFSAFRQVKRHTELRTEKANVFF